MAGLARYALPGIIVLTSVGAFLMCLLVIRYGFGGREMETDDDARGLVMIRAGHAVAGVCFAGAALLAVVALPALSRPPAPPAAKAAPPEPTLPTAALDEQAQEIARLRDALHQTQLEIEDKLSAMDSRVTNLTTKTSPAPRASDMPARAPDATAGKRSSRAEQPASGSKSAPSSVARRALASGDVSALPSGATGHQFRARVHGVTVDVETRPLRDNQTAFVVRLLDAADRPLSADVMLVGTRADGTPVIATLQPTNEPGVHRASVPTPGEGAELRLRVVGASTRFEVSLAREVSW